MISRLIVVSEAAVLALLVVGSTSAFECYNASRSDQGNISAAKAPALASFAEILADPEVVGLCPAGVEYALNGIEEAGYDPNTLINFRTLMAQGLEKNEKGEDLLHDGQGIDHLDEQFFETADAIIGDAFALCAAP